MAKIQHASFRVSQDIIIIFIRGVKCYRMFVDPTQGSAKQKSNVDGRFFRKKKIQDQIFQKKYPDKFFKIIKIIVISIKFQGRIVLKKKIKARKHLPATPPPPVKIKLSLPYMYGWSFLDTLRPCERLTSNQMVSQRNQKFINFVYRHKQSIYFLCNKIQT